MKRTYDTMTYSNHNSRIQAEGNETVNTNKQKVTTEPMADIQMSLDCSEIIMMEAP